MMKVSDTNRLVTAPAAHRNTQKERMAFPMTNKELGLKFYDEVFNGWEVSHLDE